MSNIEIVVLVCKSGRLDAMLTAISRSIGRVLIYVISEVDNDSLRRKAQDVFVGQTDDRAFVTKKALEVSADLVVFGPEEPLAAGVVDALAEVGIPSVGPTQALARIESSKAFARHIVQQIDPALNPKFRVFETMDGLEQFMNNMGDFVVKPDGLTGGKGVQLFGQHLKSVNEALSYCEHILFKNKQAVIIEEKIEGEEFSFQSFTDGITTVGTFPIQDHKRAYTNDEGPNTGGMGSYSCADHLLPFLDRATVDAASLLNEKIVRKLHELSGVYYKGILFGGFIATKSGLKLIEYNCRFGDPEVMNVLSILRTDFLEICARISNQTLADCRIEFEKKATVCKYVVPVGYPNNPVRDQQIHIPSSLRETQNLHIYWGAINSKNGKHTLYGSRALAFVGIGDTLEEAEAIAERAASSIEGPVFHREDIGTTELVQKRVQHMERLKKQGLSSAA